MFKQDECEYLTSTVEILANQKVTCRCPTSCLQVLCSGMFTAEYFI